MTCIICLETITTPFSFLDADPLCKNNHVFCIGCIYEYVRYTFQLSEYKGKCKCPLDRKEYELKSVYSRDILDIIEINETVLQSLDPEELVTCSICEEITPDAKFQCNRKCYFDHWKAVHFGNDDHLLILRNKPNIPIDNNYGLLDPELVTQEAIDRQRWIEAQLENDRRARTMLEMRIARLRDKEQRSLVLDIWKKLWADARILCDTISESGNHWEELYSRLETQVAQNQEKTNAMFDIYNYEGRTRALTRYANETEEQFTARKQGWDHNRINYGGDIWEYIQYLKKVRKDKENYYEKYIERCKRRKANRLARKLNL